MVDSHAGTDEEPVRASVGAPYGDGGAAADDHARRGKVAGSHHKRARTAR